MHKPNQIDLIVGGNLQNLRSQAGYTQEAFGTICERPITAQQVSKYERGENQITAQRLVEFAHTLGCPLSELFVGISDLLPQKTTRRGDTTLMKDYLALSDELQESVKVLVHAMVKEFAQKGKNYVKC